MSDVPDLPASAPRAEEAPSAPAAQSAPLHNRPPRPLRAAGEVPSTLAAPAPPDRAQRRCSCSARSS